MLTLPPSEFGLRRVPYRVSPHSGTLLMSYENFLFNSDGRIVDSSAVIYPARDRPLAALLDLHGAGRRHGY